ncbi:MAG: hypothetical protein GC193_14535 [Cryomorphaceae bacterium]|nr:hypothetical protein [Cryomorphaceae bacterium]
MMRIFVLVFMLTSCTMTGQQTKLSFEFASGTVIPFSGHWETAQLTLEDDHIRFIGGFDYARYDKINIQYLQSYKYAAWVNYGFFGAGYILRRRKLELTPSLAFFIGNGFSKLVKEINASNCSGCSSNQPNAFYYAGRLAYGARLALNLQYPLLQKLDGGLSAVYYPVMIADYGGKTQKPATLQLSLAYTLWRQK